MNLVILRVISVGDALNVLNIVDFVEGTRNVFNADLDISYKMTIRVPNLAQRDFTKIQQPVFAWLAQRAVLLALIL